MVQKWPFLTHFWPIFDTFLTVQAKTEGFCPFLTLNNTGLPKPPKRGSKTGTPKTGILANLWKRWDFDFWDFENRVFHQKITFFDPFLVHFWTTFGSVLTDPGKTTKIIHTARFKFPKPPKLPKPGKKGPKTGSEKSEKNGFFQKNHVLKNRSKK